jgi:uncharacterized protein YaeQ
VYHFSIDLSDTDRGVYESFKIPTALHPSESLEFMMARVIAYALEYCEGISFSPGIGATDEPALSVKGLDGAFVAWIDVGAPNPERLHRAAKLAQRVAVYCHRSAEVVYQQLTETPIFRAEQIPFYSFEDTFVSDMVAALDRRNDISVSRSDGTLYIHLNGKDITSRLIQRHLKP